MDSQILLSSLFATFVIISLHKAFLIIHSRQAHLAKAALAEDLKEREV